MHALNAPGGLLRNTPVLGPTLALAAGIAAAEWCGAVRAIGFWGAVLIATVAALSAWWSDHSAFVRRPWASVTFGGCTFLFFFWMGAALCISSRNNVATNWPAHTRVTTYAVVIESPKASARAVSTTVCLKGGTSDGRLIRLSLPTSHDSRPLELTTGQALLISTTIRPPYNFVADPTFDYATYLRRHGISGQAFCPAHAWQLLPEGVADTLRSTLPLFTRLRLAALSLRDRLVSQYVDHVAGSGRGVVTALTLGDTSEIDRPTRDTYSQTGASHVLSLSGLHLSILFGVVKLLLLDRCSRRTTRTACHLLAIAGLWAFALLAGLPVSLVRSTAMYSILCLADMSQRPNASFNSLATAAFFILLCAPMALFDVSFQLSFLSVAAILLILPLLTPKPGTWLTRFFTSFVTLPVVAQIVVAPLVALYFQTIPLYFLVANLVAVPASTAILILAIPFFIVPADSVQDCIGQVMGWAAETMNAAMNAIASWPYAYVTFRPSTAGVVMAYATIVAATLWLVRRRRADAYLFIGCTTLTACTELVMHSPLVIK